MVAGLIIFAIIVFIINAGLITYIAVLYFLDRFIELEDSPIEINLDVSVNKGVALGVGRSAVKGKEGRIIVEQEQRDVSPSKFRGILLKEKKFKTIKFPVDKGKRIIIPKTDMSEGRNIVFNFPSDSEDLPSTLKRHTWGKIIQMWIEIDNADNATIDALIERNSRIENAMKKYGGGEVSGKEFERVNTFYSDLLKQAADAKSKDKILGQVIPSTT